MAPSDTPIGGDRPRRFCPLCLIVDDHPRHVFGQGEPNVARHMDCCREAGCPDGSCNVVTAGADELRGAELLEHIAEVGDFTDAIAEYQAEHPELLASFVADAPHVIQGVPQ